MNPHRSRRLIPALLAAGSLLALLPAAAPAAPRYRAFPIQVPGFAQARVYGLTDFRQMPGSLITLDGRQLPVLFDWFRTRDLVSFTLLRLPAGRQGAAYAANNAGAVGGEIFGNTSYLWRTVEDPGVFIPPPPGAPTAARDSVTAVGLQDFAVLFLKDENQAQSYFFEVSDPLKPGRPIQVENSRKVIAVGFNARGRSLVTYIDEKGKLRAQVRNSDGTLSREAQGPPGGSIIGNNLLSDGTVLGAGVLADGTIQAGHSPGSGGGFRFTPVTTNPPQKNTTAVSGNDSGMVGINGIDLNGLRTGFVYDNRAGQGFDLNSVTTGIPPGARIIAVVAMNAAGDLVVQLSNGLFGVLLGDPPPNQRVGLIPQREVVRVGDEFKFTLIFDEKLPFDAEVTFTISNPFVAYMKDFEQSSPAVPTTRTATMRLLKGTESATLTMGAVNPGTVRVTADVRRSDGFIVPPGPTLFRAEGQAKVEVR